MRNFHLDNSRPRHKLTCPACGHGKVFVPYVDESGQPADATRFGRCDREFNCGYHCKPWEHLSGYLPRKPIVIPKPKPTSFIPEDSMKETLGEHQENPLFRFLAEKFGDEAAVARLFDLYHVGTDTHHIPGATIFWQVDSKGRVHTGKLMRYGADGHRVRTGGFNVTWMHSLYALRNFNLRQCFFGEHLLTANPANKVMLVESEKTAIICAHFFPQFTWLATGGCQGCLNPEAIEALRGREVWLVPDLDAVAKWEAKLPMLRRVCQSANVAYSILNQATPEQLERQWDIADFLLQ